MKISPWLGWLVPLALALSFSCAGNKPKPCTSAQLAEIVAECAALEVVTRCPEVSGGAAGAPEENAACNEVKAQCASRVNAWELCP